MKEVSKNIDDKLCRLLLISQKEQWHVDDLEWETISFDDMPLLFQRHVATVFTHLLYGEQVALYCAQRLENEITDPISKKLCALQIQDEQRHVVFFERILKTLEEPFVLRESMKTLMTEIYNSPTLETLLVGMHILIENIAHTLFQSAQHIVTDIRISSLNTSLMSLQMITTKWMPNFLLNDESRHLAVGHILLQNRLSKIVPDERKQLEQVVSKWCQILYDMVIDPDMLQRIGLKDPIHAVQCLKDVNLRLRQLNINVQIPIPKTA
jgi:hypothetical protein